MGVRHGPGSQGFGTIKLSSSTPAAEVWVPPLVIQSVAKSLTLVERIFPLVSFPSLNYTY